MIAVQVCVYAPYQFLKRYGIKGPPPTPFLGHYKDRVTKVILTKDIASDNYYDQFLVIAECSGVAMTSSSVTSMDQYQGMHKIIIITIISKLQTTFHVHTV